MAEYLASIFGTEKDKFVTADQYCICVVDKWDINLFAEQKTYIKDNLYKR